MKRDECCTEFQKLSQILSGKEVLPDDWENIAVVLRESAKKVFGACSGREKEDKEILVHVQVTLFAPVLQA